MPDDFVDKGGNKEPVQPYAAQLAGERKYDEALKEVPSLNDLYDQWKEFKTKAKEYEEIKEKAVIPPKEDASEEEWAEFYKKIGVPENYEVPEDMTDKEFIAKKAKELGLTKKQFKKFLEYEKSRRELEGEALKAKAMEDARKTEAYFREKWGDKYEQNYNFMKKGIDILGGDKLKDALQRVRKGDIIGNDPIIIEALVKAGMLFAEDKFVGEVGGGEEDKTPLYPSMAQ